MNLKTTTHKAIELARIDHEDNIELLGIYGLCDVNQPLSYAVKNKTITDCNCFSHVFGNDCRFFYALEQVKNNKVIKYERGIGYLSDKNGKTVIVREIPIATGSDPSNQTPCVGGCTPFRCTDCDYLIAYSTVPQLYVENLLESNSLITSVAPFTPHSFSVSENSLVGRLDGNIQSLSLNENKFVEKLWGALSLFTKQIILKTSKLDIKKLATNILQFVPISKPAAKRGCLIYDKTDDQLKYYDGEKWRLLLWEEDVEA